MFCLSQSVGYAIQALACLEGSCSGQPRTVKEIASCSGVPASYLAKLVKKLVKAEILASKPGPNGGAWLHRSACSLSVLDINDAIDGPHTLDRCLLGMATCSDERSCPVHEFWSVERERIREHLKQTTLADVIAHETHLNSVSPPENEASCACKERKNHV
ncbi:Rrf2 family transcriptional regulator [Pelagicoccus sp. SDUM812005]|uniref:RrF2 family transcriptional regulator n=1 Tax=Pelagicoccus sp. SDUM812005 TaxID=3041257 RepID=UPI00280D0CE1|nr:Rrf2 family transcriptional regulator [Pelagicoccus sp. SDUM812005]MDQ8181574.1 Rrf2 family transcriptional regulator [Pelagicoccus sp. SDUM812005]